MKGSWNFLISTVLGGIQTLLVSGTERLYQNLEIKEKTLESRETSQFYIGSEKPYRKGRASKNEFLNRERENF